jgi:ribulose-phosphate 3-epimerase
MSTRHRLLQALPFHRAEIIPALFAHTIEEYVAHLELVEQSNATWAQVDIMDGRFVPARSVLPSELTGRPTKVNLEAHLMVLEPHTYFADLQIAGFKRVLLHREAYASLDDLHAQLQTAKSIFPEVGVALNVGTPVEEYKSLNPDVIQCMGVEPGASGQALLPEIYGTIEAVRSQKLPLIIAADGGINQDNIQDLRKAGVSRFILASAIFNTQPIQQNLQRLIQLISPGGI